jgi:cellobiose phosphorylase
MGYERKRGKLLDFCRLIRGGAVEAFMTTEGDLAVLRSVKYMIVLDTDTQLPPEAAWKMVGTLAHPLNQARVNPQSRKVEAGYGVLQPRMAVALASRNRSLFARLFAGQAGIDPYTHEVSNVYHDIFAESAFIGKGIYDVATFEETLYGYFPENRILSHDLIEGGHTTCGFLSDVELIEETPSSYLADAARRHRWVRGDWQIAAWLLPRVPGHGEQRVHNRLGGLPRWMIFDNLRRSLVFPVLLVLLLGGWLIAVIDPVWWTVALLAIYFGPNVIESFWAAVWKSRKLLWKAHLQRVAEDSSNFIIEQALDLVFLPFEAWLHCDAIARVAWRTLVSHRRLLEWQTADEAERQAGLDLPGAYARMWILPLAAVVVGAAIAWLRPEALPAASAFLVAWLLAPAAAWFISKPLRSHLADLAVADRMFLRNLARRTWAYFEHFVTAEHHWLPPDNFQDGPQSKVAARTSPTNIGLALLGNLAACDFGYLSVGGLVDRTAKTFATLDKLDRYRGHFYNWYDTHSCQTLRPLYVSTVDSGNLACALIALKGGLLEQKGAAIIPPSWPAGLADTLGIVIDEAKKLLAARPATNDRRTDLEHRIAVLSEQMRNLSRPSPTLAAVEATLAALEAALSSLTSPDRTDEELQFWSEALSRQIEDLSSDLALLAPWLSNGRAETSSAPATAAGTATAETAFLTSAGGFKNNNGNSAAVSSPPHEAVERLSQLDEELSRIPTLPTLAAMHSRLAGEFSSLRSVVASGPWADWLARTERAVAEASRQAAGRITAIDDLVGRSEELADLDLDFLYDPARKLLVIGYSVENRRRDPSFYDLLASEARMCSYLGVAQGKLPQEHWFLLGRQLTKSDGAVSLLSWSGSMFEYLMPVLLLPNFAGTLLDQACRGAVRQQIRYGRQRHVPWGISESCFNLVDAQMNYQYSAFGVPQLGLKRGLADNLVIAPYATVMALMVDPTAALANLKRMSSENLVSRFGLYEAVDYTPGRIPADQSRAVVRCFMAHHSGMSLLSLDNLVNEDPMQRRFVADPEMLSSLLLLQERVPAVRVIGHEARTMASLEAGGAAPRESAVRVYTTADLPAPEVHLLSNGRYHVMVTTAGGGYSHWQNLGLTRWREDVTRDDWGLFLYMQDVQDGQVWSCAHQPVGRRLDRYEVVFSQGRAEFRATCRQIETHLTIAVSPEDDIELRQLTISNLSERARTLELTSFTEVILAEPQSEVVHPAFNSLFIQTEALTEPAVVLCTRRPQSSEESPPWMFQSMVVHGSDRTEEAASFETDRWKFLGRGRTARNPVAMESPGSLSNSSGAVLDPCLALRTRLRLAAGESVTVDVVMGISKTRDEAVALAGKYRDSWLAARVLELAWTHSQVLLQQLPAGEEDAQLFLRYAGPIIFAQPRYRAHGSLLARNHKGQADLWRYGVSGDLPIVLLRITDQTSLDLARRMVQAHAYWQHKGLRVDLFIWVEGFAGYRQSLYDQIVGLVNAGPETKALNQPGGIFVHHSDQMPEDDRMLLQAAARVIVSDRAGTLAEQADRRIRPEVAIARLRPSRSAAAVAKTPLALPTDLVFNNGLGGFTPDGREYVIIHQPGSTTPAPWSNVLANPRFGSVVTESGGGYTWYENAHEFRLTPWHNDPLTDACGEAFYIRDEETGRYWSPTPQPAVGRSAYVCRHGLGYSVFEHTEEDMACEMNIHVATEAPVKCVIFTLHNLSDRRRRISVTGFCEWVLGQTHGANAMHVVTRLDPQTGAIFAFNSYNDEFAGRVAFFQSSEPDRTFTASRTEFLGRNGTPAAPQAMTRQRLSNRVGAGFDPCAAIQAYLDIPAGQQRQVVFVLGAARDDLEAYDLLNRFSGEDGARESLATVWEMWKRLLGAVYVETPDPAVNFLVNYWLLYQTLAARLWGRSGYYQSGGAYGFRDQLQDSTALLVGCPWLARQHLLLAAGRQFREGDVQHWWHPPSGRGVRSRCSDDYLWLVYAACQYVTVTGDTGILDESVPFLMGRPLEPQEESYYDLPHASVEPNTLWDHCARAIRHSLRFGAHGLPLIGCGDWNDGLNRVGKDGQGESVWLAFFLYDVLTQFATLAERRSDPAMAEQCRSAATALKSATETHAWDGQWYLRAYFDDGQPLGSTHNPECQIDSLPQSWATLSGAAPAERAKAAMKSVLDRLVDEKHRLIKLFDPPFDAAPWDPGYIKGYLPGVRENGGQYTHAAIWFIMALAEDRDAAQAWRLMEMINPIHHGDSAERIATYRAEPYVVTADVYTAAGHEGRGGWSWYTGSAGWMYRLLVEKLLGLSVEGGDTMNFAPVVPPEWKEFKIHYRFRGTTYHVTATVRGRETWNVARVTVDGAEQPDRKVHLVDDHQEHAVNIELGGPAEGG